MNDTSNAVKGKAFNLKESVDYADGSVVSKTLIKKDIGNVTLFAFDAGQGLSEHTAPFDALVYIIDGKAQVVIDSKEYTLDNGEMIMMPANKPHSLKAIEKFKMVLVMIRA